jgi:hypothetical protein
MPTRLRDIKKKLCTHASEWGALVAFIPQFLRETNYRAKKGERHSMCIYDVPG